MALSTRTKFQLEMLIGSAISATHKFRENILESSWTLVKQPPVSCQCEEMTLSHWVPRIYNLKCQLRILLTYGCFTSRRRIKHDILVNHRENNNYQIMKSTLGITLSNNVTFIKLPRNIHLNIAVSLLCLVVAMPFVERSLQLCLNYIVK